MLDDLQVGVDVCEPLGRGTDFVIADVADAKEDLPLKVRGADDVDVDQADHPHARGREVQRDRAAQPARADAQHLRVEQFLLTFDADFGEDQVALVAVDLIGGELGDHGLLGL